MGKLLSISFRRTEPATGDSKLLDAPKLHARVNTINLKKQGTNRALSNQDQVILITAPPSDPSIGS